MPYYSVALVAIAVAAALVLSVGANAQELACFNASGSVSWEMVDYRTLRMESAGSVALVTLEDIGCPCCVKGGSQIVGPDGWLCPGHTIYVDGHACTVSTVSPQFA